MVKATDSTRKKTSKTYDEAIALTGFGKFNIIVILATGGALLSVIVESMGGMFIIPSAQCDLNLSLSERGLLYSINFLGVVSSSHLWGYIADTKGRKIVVLISLSVAAVLTLICSFVTLPWLFILLRYINGFFIGGSSAITYAYAGEFHDNKFRANIVAWIASSVAWATILIPGLAWIILPYQWSFEIPFLNVLFRPWRLLLLIYAIPSIISFILISWLPESPKYLLLEDKKEEVINILKKMYRMNSGRHEEEYPVNDILWDEGVVDETYKKREGLLKSVWKQTRPVFAKEYFLKTILVCYTQFAIFFINNSMMMWYPVILNSMSIYEKVVPSNEVTMCKAVLYNNETNGEDIFTRAYVSRALTSSVCSDVVEQQAFLLPLIIGVCYVFLYNIIAIIINMVGPRNLLYGFITVTVLGGLCAQLLSGYTVVQITLGVFLMNGPCISIINAINVDLYPTQIRGMALAISLMFGRIGAMSGTNVIGPLMENYCDYLFYIFAAMNIVIIIVVILLPRYKPSEEDKSA